MAHVTHLVNAFTRESRGWVLAVRVPEHASRQLLKDLCQLALQVNAAACVVHVVLQDSLMPREGRHAHPNLTGVQVVDAAAVAIL
jgi:hypothetical protein